MPVNSKTKIMIIAATVLVAGSMLIWYLTSSNCNIKWTKNNKKCNEDKKTSETETKKAEVKTETLAEYTTPFGSKIILNSADITKFRVDAIVNAANMDLTRGGGVCGSIWREAVGATNTQESKLLEKEIKDILKGKSAAVGSAHATAAYNLRNYGVQWIIHTVGPNVATNYGNPQYNSNRKLAKEHLKRAYLESLRVAFIEKSVSTVMIPPISTGIYGYPGKEASELAVKACREFLKNHEKNLKNKVTIYLTCFGSAEDVCKTLHKEISALQ